MAIGTLTISPSRTRADYDAASTLLFAYAKSLPINLEYQNFSAEISDLPGAYAPPTGELLLARSSGGATVGCVAVRPLAQAGVCEMKRLYVSPSARGSGAGRLLVARLIEVARTIGYREMRLDTLSTMTAARAMYDSLGFTEIDPYYYSPAEGTAFLSLVWESSRAASQSLALDRRSQ
ncbi:MAG: GNAT family N-acetyltransferase [Caldimonas sp.]